MSRLHVFTVLLHGTLYSDGIVVMTLYVHYGYNRRRTVPVAGRLDEVHSPGGDVSLPRPNN